MQGTGCSKNGRSCGISELMRRGRSLVIVVGAGLLLASFQALSACGDDLLVAGNVPVIPTGIPTGTTGTPTPDDEEGDL